MKSSLYTLLIFLFPTLIFAKDEPLNAADSIQLMIDNIEKTLKYETGELTVGDNLAKIKVPQGFKFLDSKQAEYVIYQMWGNPKGADDKLYGLILPDNMKVSDANCWAFVIQYSDMGFVKDDDADKINYDELLKDLQKDEIEENKVRTKSGYSAVHLVGWAQKPYYDKTKKVLHWAKEIAFDGNDENTLNYNIRVLGRNGVLELNAVGSMSQLPIINENIENIINSASFQEGNRYADFNPSIDKVAGWTIGGLVAGKVLAKAGIFAFLAKFSKVIFFAIIGAGGAILNWIRGRRTKPEDEIVTENTLEEQPQNIENEIVAEVSDKEIK